MKKWLPYIIAAVVIVTLGTLMAISAKNRPRRMDERITLRQKDKIPYGTFVARSLLPRLFPQAKVWNENKAPGNWDTLSADRSGQGLILLAKQFNADDYELDRLLDFIRNGNTVLVIAKSLSYDARYYFGCNLSSFENELLQGHDDSLRVQLAQPPFGPVKTFLYPGSRYSSFFTEYDTARTQVLGRVEGGVNFIRMQAGKGHLFIHLSPLAFSNYFVLHKTDNRRYFEQVFSSFPSATTKIAWSEYYLNKPNLENQRDPSLFRVLFKYPSFRWAIITALFALALFVLLETRRKQRFIPVVQPPKNESLEFVKTIGRLYYDQKDHANLGRKMAAYFLEHIRSQYKISTHTLDADFVASVHAKTGYPAEELTQLTQTINFIQTGATVSGEQLGDFYGQLQRFYQHS